MFIYSYVVNRVPAELISDLFPARLKVWEFMTAKVDRLKSLVDYAVDKYLGLYDDCSKGPSKCSELFLQLLAFVRSITCLNEHTPETTAILESVLENSGMKLEMTMTVLAVIMNAIYMGVQKQMAKTVE